MDMIFRSRRKDKGEKPQSEGLPFSVDYGDSSGRVVVVKAAPNMVVGRNVAVINKSTQQVYGVGKVIRTTTERAFVRIQPIGSNLVKARVATPAPRRNTRIVVKVKHVTHNPSGVIKTSQKAAPTALEKKRLGDLRLYPID